MENQLRLKEGPRVQISAKIAGSLVKELRKIAKEKNLKVNFIIERAIENWLR